MFWLFVFIFGLIIGSFLNVVIFRFEQETLSGRSHCLSCKKQLAWYDLFPLVSFLILQGKCRHCRKSISWQYPLVEISTGFLFVLNLWLFCPTVPALINCLILSLLLVIVVQDLRHFLLPTNLVMGVAVFGLLYSYLNGYFLPALLAGAFWFFTLWLLWFISRGRALGNGDASLMMALSFWLGAQGSFTLFLLAVWLGAAWGIALIIFSRLFKKVELVTMKSKLPFAPFLVFGALVVLFYDLNLWTIFWG